MPQNQTKAQPKRKVSARALLTPAQARRAYQLYHKRGFTQPRLAEIFNISQSAIWMLVTGRTYRKVTKHAA